jgi:hypothetical protein
MEGRFDGVEERLAAIEIRVKELESFLNRD